MLPSSWARGRGSGECLVTNENRALALFCGGRFVHAPRARMIVDQVNGLGRAGIASVTYRDERWAARFDGFVRNHQFCGVPRKPSGYPSGWRWFSSSDGSSTTTGWKRAVRAPRLIDVFCGIRPMVVAPMTWQFAARKRRFKGFGPRSHRGTGGAGPDEHVKPRSMNRIEPDCLSSSITRLSLSSNWPAIHRPGYQRRPTSSCKNALVHQRRGDVAFR